MNDLISRRAAIEAIEEMQMPIMRSELPKEQFVFTGMSESLRVIKNLPSAQPERISGREVYQAGYADGYKAGQEERKKGRWDRTEDEYGDFLCWSCSECGERYVLPHHMASYCPNCGAIMKGEDDD